MEGGWVLVWTKVLLVYVLVCVSDSQMYPMNLSSSDTHKVHSTDLYCNLPTEQMKLSLQTSMHMWPFMHIQHKSMLIKSHIQICSKLKEKKHHQH